MKRFLIISFFVLIGTVAALSYFLSREKKETKRLTGNQRSLLEEVYLYRTKDSLSAASVERLELTNQEFERYCEDLKARVEQLGIKVKRLQSVASTAVETEYKVITQLKDSVIFRDSAILLKCLELHTPYLDVSGCIDQNKFTGSILSRDTLYQIVHRIPHRFWFIKWGTKAIRQEIVSRNPDSRIVYSQYIELRK